MAPIVCVFNLRQATVLAISQEKPLDLRRGGGNGRELKAYGHDGYLYSEDRTLLDAERKTADSLVTCLRKDGFLAGRLNPDWRPAVTWCCLTGSVQIAICWSLLFRITRDERYRGAASNANRFVRRTMALGIVTDVDGGISGFVSNQ